MEWQSGPSQAPGDCGDAADHLCPGSEKSVSDIISLDLKTAMAKAEVVKSI